MITARERISLDTLRIIFDAKYPRIVSSASNVVRCAFVPVTIGDHVTYVPGNGIRVRSRSIVCIDYDASPNAPELYR